MSVVSKRSSVSSLIGRFDNNMNLADKLKARVVNHTEKNLLIEELKQLSTFDYSEINVDDKHFLIKTEKTILDLGDNFKNITIEIGKNLFTAQQNCMVQAQHPTAKERPPFTHVCPNDRAGIILHNAI